MKKASNNNKHGAETVRRISTTEAFNHFSALVHGVAQTGQTTVLTFHGRDLVEIKPIAGGAK
jgi:antitoxin (DNA-binding transcriptional repressor) of toxin-antitoxin stability system